MFVRHFGLGAVVWVFVEGDRQPLQFILGQPSFALLFVKSPEAGGGVLRDAPLVHSVGSSKAEYLVQQGQHASEHGSTHCRRAKGWFFTHCNDKAVLEDSNLGEADLTGANLQYAHLDRAELFGCRPARCPKRRSVSDTVRTRLGVRCSS